MISRDGQRSSGTCTTLLVGLIITGPLLNAVYGFATHAYLQALSFLALSLVSVSGLIWIAARDQRSHGQSEEELPDAPFPE
jgi:hypothetical protein